MAFQIQQMSFDLKQGTGIVSLNEPPKPPALQGYSVTVFFPFKPKGSGETIEREMKEEAKRLLRDAADTL
jgi:hypothetical protein